MKRIMIVMFSLVLTTMSCKKDENEPTKEQEKVEITDDSQIEIKLKRPENPFLNDFAKTQEKPGEKIGEETFNVKYPTGETIIVKLEKEEATLVSYAQNSTKKALIEDSENPTKLTIMLPNYVWIGEKDYKVTTIGDGTNSVLDKNLAAKVTDLIIPKEVTSLKEQAFSNCEKIINIEILGEINNFKANSFSTTTTTNLVKLELKTNKDDLPEGATIQNNGDGSITYILEEKQGGYKLCDFIEVSPKRYVFGEGWDVSIKYEVQNPFNITQQESFENCTIECNSNNNIFTTQDITIQLSSFNDDINISKKITFGNDTK